MAESFSQLDSKLNGIGRFLSPAGVRKLTSDVALKAKKEEFEPEVSRDLGSDRKMSNWGRFRFNVRYDLTSNGTAEITPSPANPWKVLQFGRRGGHRIPKRKGLLYKRYNTPSGVRTASRANPWRGSKSRGKGTFSKASQAAIRKTPERIQKEIRAQLASTFRG